MKLQLGLCSTALAVTMALTGLGIRVSAADDHSAIDPTGIWKLTIIPKPQSGFEPTLKLKREGDKLTGTLTQLHGGQTNEVTLEDVKLKGAQILFTTRQASRFYQKGVLQPAAKSPATESRYQGSISRDTIRGKTERELAGNLVILDWEAKRVQK